MLNEKELLARRIRALQDRLSGPLIKTAPKGTVEATEKELEKCQQQYAALSKKP